MHSTRQAAMDRWLASHHGVISRSVLLTVGYTGSAVKHLIRVRGWQTVFPGIYRCPAHPRTRAQMLTAICLYLPEAVIGFTTAGQELGLRRMTDPRIHILVPQQRRVHLPGIEVHRCRRIDPSDIATTRADGVRLTSPPRTILDAASIIGAEATESVVEQVIRDGMCGLSTLLRTASRLYHPCRPGAAVFRHVVESRPSWRGVARSDLEVRFRQGLVARGLPEPRVNALLTLSPGDVLEVDLLWEDQMLIGEIDHPYWHDGTAERRKDRRRDRRAAARGFLTTRFDEHDIEHDLDAALDDLADVLRQRGWSPTKLAS